MLRAITTLTRPAAQAIRSTRAYSSKVEICQYASYNGVCPCTMAESITAHLTRLPKSTHNVPRNELPAVYYQENRIQNCMEHQQENKLPKYPDGYIESLLNTIRYLHDRYPKQLSTRDIEKLKGITRRTSELHEYPYWI
jgi:hypothetical protein